MSPPAEKGREGENRADPPVSGMVGGAWEDASLLFLRWRRASLQFLEFRDYFVIFKLYHVIFV